MSAMFAMAEKSQILQSLPQVGERGLNFTDPSACGRKPSSRKVLSGFHQAGHQGQPAQQLTTASTK